MELEKLNQRLNSTCVRLHVQTSVSCWSTIVHRSAGMWIDKKNEDEKGKVVVTSKMEFEQSGLGGFLVGTYDEGVFAIASIVEHIHDFQIDSIYINTIDKKVFVKNIKLLTLNSQLQL